MRPLSILLLVVFSAFACQQDSPTTPSETSPAFSGIEHGQPDWTGPVLTDLDRVAADIHDAYLSGGIPSFEDAKALAEILEQAYYPVWESTVSADLRWRIVEVVHELLGHLESLRAEERSTVHATEGLASTLRQLIFDHLSVALHIDNDLGTYSFWVGLIAPEVRHAAGQTFIAEGGLLEGFSLWVERRCMYATEYCTDPRELFSSEQTFAAHVGRWDSSTGRVVEVLWSGPDRTVGTTEPNVPEQFWFDTRGVELREGESYVAYLTYTASINGFFGIKRGSDAYAGGTIATRTSCFSSTDPDPPLCAIDSAHDAYDFRAVFTPGPPIM